MSSSLRPKILPQQEFHDIPITFKSRIQGYLLSGLMMPIKWIRFDLSHYRFVWWLASDSRSFDLSGTCRPSFNMFGQINQPDLKTDPIDRQPSAKSSLDRLSQRDEPDEVADVTEPPFWRFDRSGQLLKLTRFHR